MMICRDLKNANNFSSQYLQSLEYAESGAEEELEDDAKKDMALAYANRSAVWNDRGEHGLAIRDADLAFEANYPDELQHKLYERKGQCFMALGKSDEAKQMLKKSIETIEKSKAITGERRKAKVKALQKMLDEAAELECSEKPDSNDKYLRKLVPDLPNPHPKFPSFSDAIKVEYDPQGVRGRYCVASRDLEPGELLAVESPHVWLLDKEASRVHCWHCFRPLLAPVPCLHCAGNNDNFCV